MTPVQWFSERQGQSILIPGGGEGNDGQCMQAWDDYRHQVQSLPYVYTPAAIDLWQKFEQLGLDKDYIKIPVGSPILVGDIIIFDSRVGAIQGHVDVCSRSGSLQDFWAYDSNWGNVKDPKTGFPILHEVHHDDAYNNYIVGYLRLKGSVMTEAQAEKIVTYLYRLGTGDYPNPGQISYWVPRVRDVATGLDELGTAMLSAQTPAEFVPYAGDQLFVKKKPGV